MFSIPLPHLVLHKHRTSKASLERQLADAQKEAADLKTALQAKTDQVQRLLLEIKDKVADRSMHDLEDLNAETAGQLTNFFTALGIFFAGLVAYFSVEPSLVRNLAQISVLLQNASVVALIFLQSVVLAMAPSKGRFRADAIVLAVAILLYIFAPEVRVATIAVGLALVGSILSDIVTTRLTGK